MQEPSQHFCAIYGRNGHKVGTVSCCKHLVAETLIFDLFDYFMCAVPVEIAIEVGVKNKELCS